jgi:long-subunit acyl-CoA synthetase (AMP-forming)
MHHVRITGAKYILTSSKTLDISIAAAEKCGIPLSKVFVLDFYNEAVSDGHQSWNTLLDHGEKDWVEVEDPNTTPAAYVSTSGTSGLPKAAVISHSYFMFQGEYQDRISAPRYKV